MPGTMRRDLVIGVDAETGKAEQGFQRTTRGASSYERELRKLERQQAKVDAAMDKVGKGMLVAGAAIAAGLALSVRAAIEWESAWAGVLKTVDGTPEQMAALEEEIRALTAVLPASHREIAAVAEAAGQLGVQREDVAAFTKTMIDMGEATNLSSDEAATALARFMNIMQTAPGDVNRLASAIVDLGNKGATTESEITEMALRIAGAGRTVGLSEQQVLGFAAALSNVGIRAEAGGTAISKVFLEIDTAVSSGSDTLEVFAETAGMTAAEFQQAYEQDAGSAIAAFVAGLARVQESGGDVNAILSELGITEIRTSDALRRLAGSGNNLAAALDLSNAAWDENTALLEEAERRYGTTAAQTAIARNQINDFAIDIGNGLLPVVRDAVGTFAAMTKIIQDLPSPIKNALGVVAGLTATVLLLGGAYLLSVPRIIAAKAALDTWAASTARAAVAARGLSAALSFMAGPWGLAVAAAVTLATVAFGIFAKQQAETEARIQDLAETLNQQTGAITENTRAWVAHKLEQDGVLEAAQRMGLDLATVTDAVLGQADAIAEVDRVTKENKDTNQNQIMALQRYGITLDQSTADALKLRGAVRGLTGDMSDAQAATLREAEAMGDAGDATADLTPAAQSAATALGLTADEADSLTSEVEDLDQALKALLGIMFGVEEAEDAAASALRRVTDAAAENNKKLDGNSEAALTNRENVRSLIEADFDLINAMAEAGASADDLTTETEKLKQKFIDQMVQAGFSEEAVERYAEAYDLIPSEVSTRVSTPGMTEAERNARNLKVALDNIPRTLNVGVSLSQSGSAPVLGGRVGFQHGGEIPGSLSAPVDSRLIAATPGEIMIRRSVAQENRAALLALNATGRWPVGSGGGRPGTSGGGLVQNIETVNVTSIGSQFRTKQIFDDLAMHGAS